MTHQRNDPYGLHLLPKREDPALSRDALAERGNELATQARQAAIDAVRQSMHTEFLERGQTLSSADIRRWRGRAREALAAWQKVDRVTSELLREIEKTESAERAGMRLTTVPDGSGLPGHYRTAWVPTDDDPESHVSEEGADRG